MLSLKRSISTMSKSSNPVVMFVLGGPGAGKGTQCANLVRDYNYVHLSAGDLLRAERQSKSKDGDLIEHYIREGMIVPVEITVKLLEKAMQQYENGKFLIDGFPRNTNNLDGWESEMKGKVDLKGVLFFDCPEDVCVERIVERGKSSGRVDDNIESLRKRFKTFYNETMPIVQHYERQSMVFKINAIAEPSEVYQDVRMVIDKL